MKRLPAAMCITLIGCGPIRSRPSPGLASGTSPTVSITHLATGVANATGIAVTTLIPTEAAPSTSPVERSHVPASAVQAFPVQALPTDLTPTSLAPATITTDRDDGDNRVLTDGDIAREWVLARSLARFDDAPGVRSGRLRVLCSSPDVIGTALASALGNGSAVTATWAVIDDVQHAGAGWWRVSYRLVGTTRGEAGPSSTAQTLVVGVVDGRVTGERP
jgi:hypothetical protein